MLKRFPGSVHYSCGERKAIRFTALPTLPARVPSPFSPLSQAGEAAMGAPLTFLS
jgi:hypothetical protein